MTDSEGNNLYENSDTSVTVRIVNVTDKDIQCGEDFCLETQDEETGQIHIIHS